MGSELFSVQVQIKMLGVQAIRDGVVGRLLSISGDADTEAGLLLC